MQCIQVNKDFAEEINKEEIYWEELGIRIQEGINQDFAEEEKSTQKTNLRFGTRDTFVFSRNAKTQKTRKPKLNVTGEEFQIYPMF